MSHHNFKMYLHQLQYHSKQPICLSIGYEIIIDAHSWMWSKILAYTRSWTRRIKFPYRQMHSHDDCGNISQMHWPFSSMHHGVSHICFRSFWEWGFRVIKVGCRRCECCSSAWMPALEKDGMPLELGWQGSHSAWHGAVIQKPKYVN